MTTRKYNPSEPFQRHHDHYVRLARKLEGRLTKADQRNYDLAMERERKGLVKPLPEDDQPTSDDQ